MEQVFDTWVTRTLGIRHPLLVGGMMWLGRAELVAAVVNAGATGFLSALTFSDPIELRDEIQKCRDLSGNDRFGVNLYISNRPDANERLMPLLDVVCEEKVPFVETSGGKPSLLVPKLKEAGVLILHKVPAVRYALSAEKAGVDAVILVGAECGGHPGHLMIGTMIHGGIAPKALSVPVILGGGIGAGSQMAAALAMGCEGVLMGTRMMVAEEAIPHADFKQRVVESDGTDSIVVQTSIKNHHRVLHNDAAEKVRQMEADGVDDFEQYRPILSGKNAWNAYATGDVSNGLLDWGQSACFAADIEPAADIIDGLLREAKEAAATLSSRLV